VTDITAINTSTCTAAVTIEDVTPPFADCQDITVQLDGTGNVTADPSAVNDLSTDVCGVLGYSLDISAFDCSDVGANNVILTVTDVNSNTSTCTAVITVEDNVDPMITCPGAVSVIADVGSCVATGVALGSASVTDNCIAGGAVSNDAPASYALGSTTVTWTVTDANTISCTQTVTVTVPVPTITEQPIASQTLCVGNSPAPLTVTAVGGHAVAAYQWQV